MDIRSESVLSDVVEWDVSNWSRALSFWSTIVSSLEPQSSRILCVGERNGGLSLWFALQGFKVVCSDFGGPSAKARTLHLEYGVSGFIEYADINAFEMKYADNCFDLIACKSVIGGLKLVRKDPSTRTLENQKLAISEIYRVLRPGGYFLGAENMRGSFLHQIIRGLLKGKKIGWRHLRMSELELLFSEFSSTQFKFFGFFGQYVPGELLRRLFAKVDRIISTILPSRWLYIAFIISRK